MGFQGNFDDMRPDSAPKKLQKQVPTDPPRRMRKTGFAGRRDNARPDSANKPLNNIKSKIRKR